MTSNWKQVLDKLNNYAREYGLNINPKRWIHLPHFGWMNPRILSLSMTLYNDFDIHTMHTLEEIKIKTKLKNKKYEHIKNDILINLTGDEPHLGLVVVKYLVSMILNPVGY